MLMPARGWRHRCYEVLEPGGFSDWVSRLVDAVIILLVVISLITVALESVPALAAHYRRLFLAIELLALVVFSLEYALRIWTAVEHPLYRHLPPAQARMRYATSSPGLIDLIAVLPFWFAWLVPPALQVLLVLRVVRFLKLGRYSPAMRSLLDALYAERRALLGCFMILIGVALIVRTLVAGGGALATGIVLGVLFVLAGLARLYLQRRG